jgi:hypothetical protein
MLWIDMVSPLEVGGFPGKANLVPISKNIQKKLKFPVVVPIPADFDISTPRASFCRQRDKTARICQCQRQ